MTIAARLEGLLEEAGADYEVIDHAPAFTAQEEAAASHVPGRNWAKTVEVLLDGRPALCVLPATRRLDLDKLRQATGAEKAELATESELARMFPDCDLGAMPPFGRLYGQSTFVDEVLRSG
ncbi:MAG: YbaK/EbsC family protein, partial [Gemmatimonadota bacterium]|nr:YbaK/EbsC family protein [Gemmatimonadota bacterium]